MVIETVGQAKELIQNWMNYRKFINPATSSTTVPDELYFMISGKASDDIPFSILQPKDLGRTVVVLANVILGQEHFEAFNEMEPKDRENLFWDLQRSIIFAPVTYSFNPEYKKDGTFRGIQFIKEISYDELTEGRLGDAVSNVTKCVLWVIWVFRREFGPLKE